MKSGFWSFMLFVVALSGFAGGYAISEKSGTEPGYFDAVETAGYGGGSELIEGISEEMADYYKSLLQED